MCAGGNSHFFSEVGLLAKVTTHTVPSSLRWIHLFPANWLYASLKEACRSTGAYPAELCSYSLRLGMDPLSVQEMNKKKKKTLVTGVILWKLIITFWATPLFQSLILLLAMILDLSEN